MKSVVEIAAELEDDIITIGNISSENITNPCIGVFNSTLFDHKFDFWISHCCLLVVAVLGVMGNLLSMLILSRPQMKSSISAVLFGLACCDTVLLIVSVLIFSLPAGKNSDEPLDFLFY